MQSQKIPLYRVIIEEKGCTYPKELTIENCKASDGCLRQCKEYISHLKQFLENQVP